MKIRLSIVIVITLNIVGICQEDISFPLNVGNMFFYKAGSDPDDGYYGATKTIVDSLYNGVRVVSVKNNYTDSISLSTEYWKFKDEKFYISPDTFFSYQASVPIFNGSLLNDTCWNFFPPSEWCIEIKDSALFGTNRYCQKFYYHFFTHSEGGYSRVFTANNIGCISYYNNYRFGLSTTIDSIILIGYIIQGNLIGDTLLTGIQNQNELGFNDFQLYQNYPNPFNPTTRIMYSIPKVSRVKIIVYDILGNEITTLVNEEKYPGHYNVNFNGMNISSGIYFYRLITKSSSITKKFLLLK